MEEPTIGVDIDDLRMPAKEAIRTAGELGFNAVELPAVTGDFSPQELSSSGRRHLLRYLRDHGLSLAALGADMPGSRFTDPGSVDLRIARTRAILELAAGLRSKVVTASVGALTHPDTGEPSPVALEALGQIGDHADLLGATFALRPSYDSADRLVRILDELRCPALKIGLDPAAAVMVGINPLSLVEHFADQIAIVHARDAWGRGKSIWPRCMPCSRPVNTGAHTFFAALTRKALRPIWPKGERRCSSTCGRCSPCEMLSVRLSVSLTNKPGKTGARTAGGECVPLSSPERFSSWNLLAELWRAASPCGGCRSW
jgi:sugar phosphate isomerase/epimerase